MCKSAVLIPASRFVSDIKKNTVFTCENAGECKTIGSTMSGCAQFGWVHIVFGLKTTVNRFLNINVNKGLTSVGQRITLAFGSFLENVIVCGNQWRALADFFGRKSMSGQCESGRQRDGYFGGHWPGDMKTSLP